MTALARPARSRQKPEPQKVSGTSRTITVNPTIATSGHVSGDSLGGKMTLPAAVATHGGTAELRNIVIIDRANQKPTGTILIFNADPAAATLTDNSAVVLSTDDFKIVARIPVASANYVTINSKAIADLENLGREVKAARGSADLYAAFVLDGSFTMAAATNLQLIFSFLSVDG